MHTKTQSVEVLSVLTEEKCSNGKKRKTQKLKIFVASVKCFFVLGNALKISIPSLATDAEF